MSSYLVSFLLFGLFLVVIPIGISPFEAPKVIIAEVLIDLLLLIALFKFKKADFKSLISSHSIFLGMLLLLSLDQFFLFHPPGAFFGNPFRLQGLFLFLHLLVFCFLAAKIAMPVRESKLLYPLALVLLGMGTVILGFNENNRAFGTLGEPNALAATALFIWPFVYFKAGKWLKITSLALLLMIIFLSGSRAGLTAFIIEAVLIVLYSRLDLAKTVSIAIAAILLALFLPFQESAGFFENRSDIWQTAIAAGFKSPVIGHGFGNVQDPIRQTAILLNNNVQYQVVDSAHNFLLDFWIQGGAVGLTAILILIYLTLQGFVRHKKIIELTAFLGLMTVMLFNPVSVVNLLAFWWLIGTQS